jgi:hypothetical protein
VAIGGLATLIVAAVVLGGWWLAAYQPLTGGSVAGVGLVLADGTIESSTDISNVFGEEYDVIEPHRGEQIRMRAAFRNDGPLSVTITGVDLPLPPAGEWRTVVYTDVDFAGEETKMAPGGVTVAPGHFVQLRFDAEAPDCPPTPEESRGGKVWIEHVTVRYTVLGIEHTRSVDLGYAVGIVDGPACWLR